MKPGLLNNKWPYIIAALLGAGWWWLAAGGNGSSSGPPAANVTVAPVMRQDVPLTVALVGSIIAYETVAVKSRLDSQIVAVLFKDGDYVKEGQKLFELDDRTVRAHINELAASVAKEKAQLVNMQLQYERAQKLVKTNTVAQAQVDSAKAAYEAQLAMVNAAQANLDSARVQLSYTGITAPISGRAGTINVTRGNNVKANDTSALVTINQISPIRAQFSIPQRYYDQVRAALAQGEMKVEAVRSESREEPTVGTLEYLDNAIDTATGTFAARAVFANEDEKLWPGMFVNVTLKLGTELGALTIPSVAVQGDEGSHFVFVANAAEKKAARRPVDIALNNGTIAIVAKGLEESEQVIVDGLLRVTDGGAIDIVPAEKPTP